MTTITDPMELLVRRLLLIQRWGNTVSDEATARVEELFQDLTEALIRGHVDGGGNLQRFRAVLEGEIDRLTPAAYEDVLRIVRDGTAEFGVQQGRSAALQLRAVLGAGAAGEVEVVALTMEQVRAMLQAEPIVGAPLEAWYQGQSERVRFQVKRQIQLGYARGETIDDIVRRIRGKATGAPIRNERGQITGYRFTGGILATSTREAETIARTAINHISNRASLEVFRANQDVAPRVRYTATLDSRVSVLCASNDGKEWPLDDPQLLVPPLHPNCRSVLIPLPDWVALGLEPPPEGTRASANGQVDASTTAEQWLKDAPKTVQDEVLGPARAKLFRENRVSLRDLVKSDGRRVTLEDLRAS
jgi:SPP1 gp7 family putative phage head morphogenesis protein